MNLFTPRYNYGHPTVGWVSARATGRMVEASCPNLATGQTVIFTRNEDGIRTAHSAQELRQNSGAFKVAVGGDSHTDLCEPNDKVHFGVMERELNSLALPSAVFAFGAGKYSPLQAYLAVRVAQADGQRVLAALGRVGRGENPIFDRLPADRGLVRSGREVQDVGS